MTQAQQDTHQQLINMTHFLQQQLEGQVEPQMSSEPKVQASSEPDSLKDCSNASSTGQYTISPEHDELSPVNPFPVICDMHTTPGGWIVIQRRFDGSVSFDRNWADYEMDLGPLVVSSGLDLVKFTCWRIVVDGNSDLIWKILMVRMPLLNMIIFKLETVLLFTDSQLDLTSVMLEI